MHPIDADQRELSHRGWSCGEFSYFDGEEMMWQVDCHKGEQKIIVRALGQEEAWAEALQQALKIR